MAHSRPSRPYVHVASEGRRVYHISDQGIYSCEDTPAMETTEAFLCISFILSRFYFRCLANFKFKCFFITPIAQQIMAYTSTACSPGHHEPQVFKGTDLSHWFIKKKKKKQLLRTIAGGSIGRRTPRFPDLGEFRSTKTEPAPWVC